MKHSIFIMITGLVLLSACSKVKVSRQLPAVANGNITQLSASQIAWVNQIAKEKADSIRIVDSLSKVTGVVDQNSLFNKKNMLISVVEVNDHYFPNMNCYVDQNGKPVFDLAVAFAANLNIDPSTGNPYVSFNPEWQAMLQNGTLKEVQRAGIPIGIGLLGNHDAAGWSNFPNLAACTAFAQIVAFQVRKSGFSAVLADDEYSNGPSVPAASNSYVMVMSEIKRLLPDIFLIYYEIGGGSGTYNGKQMGDIADANFPPFYPEAPLFGELNFPNNKLFTAFQEGAGYDTTTMRGYLKQGTRGIFVYNVGGGDPDFYGPYVQLLKGTTLSVPSMCLNPNATDFINGQ
jgi:hypothetical protein